MGKLVLSVAKILGASIVFSLLFAFVIYIIQIVSLNSRVNAIMDSMSYTVMTQNYLPSSATPYYESLFSELEADMKGQSNTPFLVNWSINHTGMSKSTASGNIQVPAISGTTVGTNLANPVAFGGVQVIDIVVTVNVPIVGNLVGTTDFHFTRVVPCTKYIRV